MLRRPMMLWRDDGAVEDAAVGNHRVIDLGAVDLRAGQEARPAEDRRGHVEEVEARQLVGDVEVGLEEGADGPDVLPVALEDEGEDAQVLDGVGDDVLAEIGQGVVQQAAEDVAVEDVDAHGGQEQTPLRP